MTPPPPKKKKKKKGEREENWGKIVSKFWVNTFSGSAPPTDIISEYAENISLVNDISKTAKNK